MTWNKWRQEHTVYNPPNLLILNLAVNLWAITYYKPYQNTEWITESNLLATSRKTIWLNYTNFIIQGMLCILRKQEKLIYVRIGKKNHFFFFLLPVVRIISNQKYLSSILFCKLGQWKQDDLHLEISLEEVH